MAFSLLKILEPFWLFNFHLFQPQPPTPESQDPYPAPATVPGSLQPQASPVPGGPGSHPRVPSTQPCPAPESRAELTFFRLFFDFLLPPVIRQG